MLQGEHGFHVEKLKLKDGVGGRGGERDNKKVTRSLQTLEIHIRIDNNDQRLKR